MSYPMKWAQAFAPRTYVLGRRADFMLGIATGCLAFYMNEHNPRTAPAPGESLYEAVGWRVRTWREEWSRTYAERQQRNLERDLAREREASLREEQGK
ncbi:hypothetical protein BKA62DRAFT_765403 [Auriculariales sp. MPI-PUGE-AT-0066]|nr:hypothetical protein BKA62DRAFT_765403 [Auriculariales sp. MPI-PUGE-AT-0066]